MLNVFGEDDGEGRGGGVGVERELQGERCRRDCGKSDLVRGMRKLAGD